MSLFVCSSCFACSTIQNGTNYQKNTEAAIVFFFHIRLLCLWVGRGVWIAEIILSNASNCVRPPVQICFSCTSWWGQVQPSVISASFVLCFSFDSSHLASVVTRKKTTTVLANCANLGLGLSDVYEDVQSYTLRSTITSLFECWVIGKVPFLTISGRLSGSQKVRRILNSSQL